MEILQQFKELIPPLSNEEYKQLEANCLDEGIREPILTWNNYIIDGHNRYNIAKQWNLEFETKSKNFNTIEDVKIWMLDNQFGKRNLSDAQRYLNRNEKRKLLKEKGKQTQGLRTDLLSTIDKKLKPEHNTRETIANELGWSTGKVAMADVVFKKATPEIEEKVLKNQITINQAYKEIKKEEKGNLIKTTKEERQDVNKNQAIIYNESCVDFLDRFTDSSVDLLLTDPPYSTDIINVKEFIDTWLLKSLNKVKETGRAFICIGAYPIETYTYLQTLLNTDWTVDNPLVWTYRNTLGVTPKMKYNLNYQFVLHLYKETSKPLDNRITNEMFSVQDINAPDGRVGDRFHTWQKPDELAKRLINHTTNEKDIIIDPFACTGTFILNGADLGRKTYGCDIDENALKIAYERGCTKGL
jgi:DNA modification methylase